MITATPTAAPTVGPPSVLIEITSTSGSITAVSVRRNGVPIVDQPTTGSPSTAATDYQPEYGQPITYAAAYTDSAGTHLETVVTQVDSLSAWLVHPRMPAFSFELKPDPAFAGFVELGDRTNEALSTVNRTIGNPLGIVVTQGRRGPDVRTVMIGTTSKAERDALDACLSDETPLLFRFPAAWDVDFSEGFYRVGQVTKSPLVALAGEWRSRWSLPVEQVRPPKIIVQQIWTLQNVIDTYGTLQAVVDAFPTLYDEIINRPGG